MIKKIHSVYGNPYESFFQNGEPNPTGDLLGAGTGLPTLRNSWWDTRDMWTKPYYNLSLMQDSGDGFYRNESGFSCRLSSNTFFFTFPDIKAAYGPLKNEQWGELYTSFSGAIFELMRQEKVIDPAQPVWQTESLDPWTTRLRHIFEMPIPATKRQTMHRVVCFMDFILELLDVSEPVAPTELGSDWFANACQMLTGNLHEKVDCQRIARELGMSYHTFRFSFAKRAGMPPVRYRDQVRIRQTCDYLTNNLHKPCKEIAFELGYSDPHHFAKHFKKHMKMSPSEYRRKYAKK